VSIDRQQRIFQAKSESTRREKQIAENYDVMPLISAADSHNIASHE